MNGSALELEIERLVLEGLELSAGEAERLRASLEAELGRILGGEEAPATATAADLAYLKAGRVRVEHPAGASVLASDLARTIAGALHRVQGPGGGREP